MNKVQRSLLLIFCLHACTISFVHAAEQEAVADYNEAMSLYKAGKFTQSYGKCQSALVKDRKFAEAHYLLALLWARKGHYLNARKSMQDAADLGYEKAGSMVPEMAKLAKAEIKLNAPTGMRGTAGRNRVDIRWKPNTDLRAEKYGIYMSKTPGEWNYIMVARGIKENYVTIDGLRSGVTYYFAVVSLYAKDPFFESGFSEPLELKPL